MNFTSENEQIADDLKLANGYLACEKIILNKIIKHFEFGLDDASIENFLKELVTYLEFIIEDNGPGIYSTHTKSPAQKEHASMGTGITSRRIDAINEMQKNKIIWRVTDKQQSVEPANGTIIHLSFPLIPF